MFKNILVPTDGSKAAKRAVDHAIDVASEASEPTIHALYVMDMGELDYVAVPGDIAETRDRLRKKGEKMVGKIGDRAENAGIDSVTAVKSGIPDEAILEYAEENDVDLIVMGRHGKRDPDKPFLGGTAREVVTNADIPVHTV